MTLLRFPHPTLNTKCEPVLEFDARLGIIFDEMTRIMNLHKGVGLAANQIGEYWRMVVIKSTKGEIYEMANPIIIETEGTVSMSEGCLSAPDIYLDIVRPASVMIQYQDRHGEVKKAMAEGIEARAILHEIDHLEGIFYFSKVNRERRKIAISKLRKR